MAHQGSGIILKTSFDQKGNRVLRTIFDKRYVTYQTINDYVPPIFLIINYEQAAFTRQCFSRHLSENISSNNDNTTAGGKKVSSDHYNTSDFTAAVKTDEIFCDNIKFVESLLVAGDCVYDTCQVTFLRLETTGDFQRSFDKLYPLWDVEVGALIRMSFSAWPTRTRALKLLAFNAATNRDVYTIHFAANTSAVTIVDYLEPLFAYCVKKTKTDGYDTELGTRSSSSSSGAVKRSSYTAANTTEMFEINFCVIDAPTVGYRKPVAEQWDGQQRRGANNNNQSVYSSVGGSTAGTGVSKRSTGKRKRDACGSSITGGDTDRRGEHQLNVDFEADRLKKIARRASAVLERPRTMCGSLSVHDVRPYFAMLQSKRLTRISMDQLEELPVVMIRCEHHFCSITCHVLDRTDNQSTVLHVYYCWDREVHSFLTEFAGRRRKQTTRNIVAVSPMCSEDLEARLNMLRDLKNVIWKDNINAYIRLAINESHDQNMVSRNFYEPLVFRVQRTTAEVETEISLSVANSSTSGARDMFRNSIGLDCARLCNDLDPKRSAFTRTYKTLLDDSTFVCNGSVLVDRHTLTASALSRQNVARHLERIQDYSTRLVTDFCSERILDLAFQMATELRLGLLDVFGLKYTEHLQQTNWSPFKTSDRSSTDELVLHSTRVANMVFMDALTNMSLYHGTCCSVSSCNEFFGQEQNAKPLSRAVTGLYRRDLLEFDLQSAYPTVTALYNISPETTAVVPREVLRRYDETLNAGLTNDAGHAHHTSNIMTSFYHQVGHINETNSNLVIVSLRPEIYAGFLPRIMERLVLTRKNHNQLLNPFYKNLANVVYGCTGKANVFNDLFAPQCASAIRSTCRGVMTKTLQNLAPECVVLVQTDGALLYAGGDQDAAVAAEDGVVSADKLTCKQLEAIVRTSLHTIKADIGNNTFTSLPLAPRVRHVSMCLVVDQNRYLLRYEDGKTVCKGQEGQPSYGNAKSKDALLSTISEYVTNHFDDFASSPTVQLNGFMGFLFNHLNTESRTEWFLTIAIPTTVETLFNAANQEYLIGLRLDAFTTNECLTRLVDTSVARFGDTVAVWPVLVNDNGDVSNEFRTSRPLYNVAVRPNYVFVMKTFMWRWVRWFFAVCYPQQDEKHLMRMFHAICKSKENEIAAVTTA